MINILKNSYLFLILFLLLLGKDIIINITPFYENNNNLIEYKLLEDKYNKLLEFNEIDYIYNSKYYNTYIIYKDIYNYLNEITIHGGINNFKKNYLVIYDNTLIGIIDKVNKNSSQVKLITNSKSKISVKINDNIGLLNFKDNKLMVSNLSNYSDIKVGDLVYTSSLGDIKESIYIGIVKEVILTNKELEKQVIVDYKIDIKDINYVTVMENI